VAAEAHSYLIDQIVRLLHDDTAEVVYPAPNPTVSERMTLVATGGYGRAQLAPQSDVDILFLLPYKRTPHGEQVVEHMLYVLWDLGLKVGLRDALGRRVHALRQDRSDDQDRAARGALHLGRAALFAELQRVFAAEIMTGNARDFRRAEAGRARCPPCPHG